MASRTVWHTEMFPGKPPSGSAISQDAVASRHHQQAAVTPFGWNGAVSGCTEQFTACCFIHCLHLLGFVDWIIHMVAIVKWSRPEKFIFLQDPTWCGSVLFCTTPELAAAAFWRRCLTDVPLERLLPRDSSERCRGSCLPGEGGDIALQMWTGVDNKPRTAPNEWGNGDCLSCKFHSRFSLYRYFPIFLFLPAVATTTD